MPPPRRRTKILAAAKSRDVSCAAETKFSPQQPGGFAAAERIRLLFAPGLGRCNYDVASQWRDRDVIRCDEPATLTTV